MYIYLHTAQYTVCIIIKTFLGIAGFRLTVGM